MPQVHDGNNSGEEDDQDSPPCQPTFALEYSYPSRESLDQLGQRADTDALDIMSRKEADDNRPEAGGEVDFMLLGHTTTQHGAAMPKGIAGTTAAQRRVQSAAVSRRPAVTGDPLAPRTSSQPAAVPLHPTNASPWSARSPATDLDADQSSTVRRSTAPGVPMRVPPPAALDYNHTLHMATQPLSGSTIPRSLPHGVAQPLVTPRHASTIHPGNAGRQSRFDNAAVSQDSTHFNPQDMVAQTEGGRSVGTVFQNVSGPVSHSSSTLKNRSPPKAISRRQDVRRAPPGAVRAHALPREGLTTSTVRKRQQPSRAAQMSVGSSKSRHGRRDTFSRRVQDPP